MHKSKSTIIAMLLFLITLAIYLVMQNLAKPRIFILHSYNTDFSWVRDINLGIERGFKGTSYNLRWYYMDTKHHPDQEFMERAGATARQLIDSWNPDVLIACDDDAQKFVAKYYNNHPTIRIVYTGVNKNPEDYDYDKASNVTGMLERINYQGVKDILLQVLPEEKRRIIHISDNSATSQGIHDEIHGFDWSPLQFIKSAQLSTFDDWKRAIMDAEGTSDCILFTHYHTLKREEGSKTVVPPAEVIRWTNEHSKMPGISFWGFYVEDGGMMAIALSPFEQGEVPARMAVEIINGKTPQQIPVERSHLFVMYMRGSAIKERMANLNIPLIYEAFAKAMNTYYP